MGGGGAQGLRCLGFSGTGQARAAVLLPAVRHLREEKLKLGEEGYKDRIATLQTADTKPPPHPMTVLWDKDGGTSGRGARRQDKKGSRKGRCWWGTKQTDSSRRDLFYLHAFVSHEVRLDSASREHKR